MGEKARAKKLNAVFESFQPALLQANPSSHTYNDESTKSTARRHSSLILSLKKGATPLFDTSTSPFHHPVVKSRLASSPAR